MKPSEALTRREVHTQRISMIRAMRSSNTFAIDAALRRAVVVEDRHDRACALINDQGHILDAIHHALKLSANI